MSNEIIRAFDRVWEASERRRFQHALLGRKNPNTGLWEVNEGLAAGYVWVSMGVMGDQGVAEARNSGSGRVALRRSLPVLVREENGVLVVTGEDNAHADLRDDADAEPNEYGVPSHPHAFLSLSDVLPTALVDGQIFKWDATAGKLVNVAAADTAANLAAATAKTTPVDADTVPLTDSAAGNALKKLSWANLKATLKTYLDTLYVALTGNQTIAGVKTFTNYMRVGSNLAPNYPLSVSSGAAKTVAGVQNVAVFGTSDSSNELVFLYQMTGSATPSQRNGIIQTVEQGVAYRDTLLNPYGSNLGIGTTDVESWGSGYVGVQFGGNSAWMAGRYTEGLYQVDGAYFDGTSWKRRTDTSPSITVSQIAGKMSVKVAPTGVIDSVIVWKNAFDILNNGYVGIGVASPGYPLAVSSGASKTVAGVQNVAAFGTPDDLVLLYQVTGSATASQRNAIIQAIEQGVAMRDLLLNPYDGNVGIGIAPQGKLHAQQGSTTAAIPVLMLGQADLSEEFIQFDTTVGAGNPVDTAMVGSYYGKVRVSVNGVPKFLALYDT